MIIKSLNDLFRKAHCSETRIEQLQELVNLENEALCAAVALHPNCNKSLLEKLLQLDMSAVNENLIRRYSTYPSLYSLNVREVKVNDAEYIHKLRTDVYLSKYISTVNDDVEDQRQYIIKYLNDNTVKRISFYFILENSTTGKRCGTVRIYNFNDDVFEWGSWILDGNKSRYAAMETAILIYEFAFNVLGFDRSEFKVNKRNEKVISYHKKSGANIIRQDEYNFYFSIQKEISLQFSNTLRKKLKSKFP